MGTSQDRGTTEEPETSDSLAAQQICFSPHGLGSGGRQVLQIKLIQPLLWRASTSQEIIRGLTQETHFLIKICSSNWQKLSSYFHPDFQSR